MQELLENFNPLVSEKADIIELDEIYTYVKKKNRAIVWTAYSGRQKRIIAYIIGDGVKRAMEDIFKSKNNGWKDFTNIFRYAKNHLRFIFL